MTTAAKRVTNEATELLLEKARESTKTLNWLKQMRSDYAFITHAGLRLQENMRLQERWDENADNILASAVELAMQKVDVLDKAIERTTEKHDKIMRELENWD
ncbi:MAG TPA: hypothetical protein V6C97_21745 [Oculatellaceae cyanobacterium]